MANAKTWQQEQMEKAEDLLFSEERLPSFVKGLFMGAFDAARVLPFPQPTMEERKSADAFIHSLSTWADAHLNPDTIDRQSDIPGDVIRGLADLGVLSCTIPHEFGGQGISQYGYCRMVEEVARRCQSTALFINAHQSIGMKALLLFGTDEQKGRWLPPLARGDVLAAFALTEPNAGSDAAGVETRAVYDAERDVYRITGRKQWITNGGIAGILTVMAQTEVETPKGREDKITAFLVTPDMPGFEVEDVALEKVGMRGTKTAKLRFTDMEVPAANILGPKGGGLKVALTVLDFGRTTFGAGCTGNAKECLRLAVEHARTRHQFKRPLASFGMVKSMIAGMAARVYAMEASTYLTAGLLDRGEEDFMLETAIIKVFCSECQWQILYDTMQIYGGRSFFTDHPFERMMRDARLNTIGEGSNEVLRAFIGVVGVRDLGVRLKDMHDSVLTNPIHALGKMLHLGKDYSKSVRAPLVPVRSAAIAEEAGELGARVRRFGLAIPRLLAKYREGLVEEQLRINRIATAAIALYTVTAVIGRLDSELHSANGGGEMAKGNLSAGKLYCRMAFAEFDAALDSLFKNDDESIYAVSDEVTGVTWPAES
ncbi:MAG: acyl-CoA dehydrogenase [Candidatus Hydrogenedentota bacterium]